MRKLKTWISEDTGSEATIDALMSVIGYFRISLDRARWMLAEVERTVSRWRDQGRALGMTDSELEAFAEAFEHPERDAARRVIAG